MGGRQIELVVEPCSLLVVVVEAVKEGGSDAREESQQ